MRAFVGVTDGEWYRFLAARPYLNEVNFWRPSGTATFRALVVGEPFLFKTHYPHNRIVGGGFYADFVHLLASEAWGLFGEGNGAESFDDMRRRIARYRREPVGAEDLVVGCVMLRDVQFFPPDEVLPAPQDFKPNVVQGKGYDLDALPISHSVGQASYRLVHPGVWQADPTQISGPMFGDPNLVARRLGQRSFQAVVLEAYGRRCAITGTRIRPVLQAAHIRPVASGGEHRLDNGLLLRSDVHTLFDSGYLGLDLRHRLRVSPQLRTQFGNGETFYALAGETVTLPERRADRPNREFLEWHNDTVFRASTGS
ncbi:MAG: HNH endonuclease [Micromonosporaceae bacterium]